MATYKLTYFDAKGRAEICRMLFVAADKSFEDSRLDGAEFQKQRTDKSVLPQGVVPVLEVNGKLKITQSFSIARYLAREFKLYGKDNTEAVMIDQIMDTLLDLVTPFFKAAFSKDEEEKKTLMEKFTTEVGPKYLGFLEDLVKQTGKNGFAVGQSLTLGDVALYTYLELTHTDGSLDKFPILAKNRKNVEEQPLIKKYLANRQQTPF